MRRYLTIYQQVFKLLRRYPLQVSLLIVSALLSTLAEGMGLGILLPLLDPSLGDNFVSGISSQIPFLVDIIQQISEMTLIARIRLAVLLLMGFTFIRSLLLMGVKISTVRLQLRVERYLQELLFDQIHTVELRFLYRQNMGAIITTLNRQVWQSGWLVQEVVAGLGDLLILVVYAFLLLYLSWELTFISVALLGAILAFNLRLFSKPLALAGRAQQDSQRKLRSFAIETLSGMKLIRLFRKEKERIATYQQALATYEQEALRGKLLENIIRPLFSVIGISLVSLLLFVATWWIPTQVENSLGAIVLFLIIGLRLLGPVSKLNYAHSRVTHYGPDFEAVFDFLNRTDKQFLPNGKVQFTDMGEGIRLDEVTFRYGPQENDVLEDICFSIPAGKMTAIVGPSGAGKSTLIDLLARLYDCDSGHIYVDGIDIRNLDLTSWRRTMAVVNQDTHIFDDTVRANLLFAKSDATEEEIIEAAMLAQIHKFIQTLPDGYHTRLGTRGVRLSGGQQQRIAIARALLTQPQLLILDEATSELDSETEYAIQRAIEKFGSGRTLVVVAHRLSTIRNADNIIVVDAGRVVEEGSHEELMAEKRLYWRLVKRQKVSGNQ